MTASGQSLKDHGQAAVLAAVPDAWREAAEQAIAQLAASGAVFTVDDVLAITGPPGRANAMGAIFTHACRHNVIRTVGYVQASRRERRGGIIRRWQGMAA